MIKDVPSHDLVVLTSIKNSVALCDYLKSKIDSNGITFQNPLSVVEFTRIDSDTVQFFLRIAWGSITNHGLARPMRNGITVSAAEIVSKMSMFWFYDSEPHVVYTIAFLWEKIFPAKLDPEIFEISGRKKVKLDITIKQIVSTLDEISGPMPKPKAEWIRKGMDELVVMGMAKRQDKDHYSINYHKLPGKQPLRTFAEKWARTHPNASLTPFLGRARPADGE